MLIIVTFPLWFQFSHVQISELDVLVNAPSNSRDFSVRCTNTHAQSFFFLCLNSHTYICSETVIHFSFHQTNIAIHDSGSQGINYFVSFTLRSPIPDNCQGNIPGMYSSRMLTSVTRVEKSQSCLEMLG